MKAEVLGLIGRLIVVVILVVASLSFGHIWTKIRPCLVSLKTIVGLSWSLRGFQHGYDAVSSQGLNPFF